MSRGTAVSLGDGPVNIVIKATDQASKTTAAVSQSVKLVEVNALNAAESMGKLSSSIAIVSGQGVAAFGQLYSAIDQVFRLLEQPTVQAFIQTLNQVGEAAVSETQTLTASLSGVLDASLGQNRGQALGNAMGRAFGERFTSNAASAINVIDQKILGATNLVGGFEGGINDGLGTLAAIPGLFTGIQEPIQIFNALKGGVDRFASGIFGAIQELGQFSNGMLALQQIAQFGPFQALIQQNAQLRQELLATQTSLAATNEVIIGGVQTDDPGFAIQALEGSVTAAVNKMRQDSLELVGVTSKELVSVFNIITSQISGVGGGLNDASDLTISLAAALGTLQIPLDQARQEINSILQGQITSDSLLAKSIGLTNQQVQIWRQQGTVVDNLQERLAAFREGNALAAQSISGISSNIQEVIDESIRLAGEPLLDPIIQKLDIVYQYVQQNQGAIQSFIGEIVEDMIRTGEAVSRVVGTVFGDAVEVSGNVVLFLFESLAKAAEAAADGFIQIYPAFRPFIEVLKAITTQIEAVAPLFTVFVQLKVAQLAVTGFTRSLSVFANGVPFVGEALALIQGRSSGLISQFIGLRQQLGVGSAGFLLLGKNIQSLGPVMDILRQKAGPFAPLIAQIIPQVSQLGIAVTGLSTKFPIIRQTLESLGGKALPLFQNAVLSNSERLTTFLRTTTIGGGVLAKYADDVSNAATKLAKYTNITEIAADVNVAFSGAMTQAARGVGDQVRTMGLYAIAAGGLFFAIDQLILKNEAFQDILEAVGEVASTVGTYLINFLREPVVLVTIALASLAVLIQTGVIPSLINLATAQIAAASGAVVAQVQSLYGAFLL